LELVAVARIVRTRALKGEVVAEILTDFEDRFELLDDVTLVADDGGRRELKIEKFWFQSGRVILKFRGVDTVEQGEELRNMDVCVPESDAVELESGEYYDWQLQGCTVKTVEGEELGTVKEVMRTGGTELLVVEGGRKEYLIPFAEAICPEVDIEGRFITVDPPEGLLEF
jgi:16S rRNA processing protein RimM